MIDWIDEVGPGRKGAFWEDRYHAAAIESGEHLLRCLVYIDLNMVRAGAVSHPQEWVLMAVTVKFRVSGGVIGFLILMLWLMLPA
ncbi:MAG: hypothetical protein AB7F20_06950 [Geoalkalibacter sp.]|uniref:hypothetical protein n=1 Tax=Geoalkalibacter sp. TaxID=3041440 RepID=UPI003D09FC50